MSVRLRRKQHGQVIADRLEVLRFEKSKNDALEEALLEGLAALEAEPREALNCAIALEYVPIQTCVVERGQCSECGKKITAEMPDGHQWRFCIWCGSSIEKITREASPFERLTNEAIAKHIQV